MKRKAQDLRVGDEIKISGAICEIRGIQLNMRNKVVLNLRNKELPYPTKYGWKPTKARRRTEVTLVVPRKTVLKLVS